MKRISLNFLKNPEDFINNEITAQVTETEMNDKIIILSVAFGKQYIKQQWRLIESIDRTNPDVDQKHWTEELPPGARQHSESLYGFKVHAVKWALEQGYNKIIWCDTACIIQKPVDYYFSKMLPIIAVKDDNLLYNTCCDKAINYFGNPDMTGRYLVGGSFYVFNFLHAFTDILFNQWAVAEADGIFGSQHEQASEQINRHRCDESCMAMVLYNNGYAPVSCEAAKYCIGEESIVVKKHFK